MHFWTTGEVFADYYDKLLIATGARATLPSVKGANAPHAFTLRNINDMKQMNVFLSQSLLILDNAA